MRKYDDRMNRKGNYAANVKKNLPHGIYHAPINSLNILFNSLLSQIFLDNLLDFSNNVRHN